MDPRDRLIIAQVAYKVGGGIHAAEVATGAVFDREYLSTMAKSIANDIVKLAGAGTATTGGSVVPAAAPSAPSAGAPLCPRCDSPTEPNKKWQGPGDKSPRWRCSQRGNFIKGSGWTGCNGAVWEDAA